MSLQATGNMVVVADPAVILPSSALTTEAYHGQPFVSCSQLKYLGADNVPLDFWRQSWMNPHRIEYNKPTLGKAFGGAAHTLLLDGEAAFRARYEIKKGVKQSKEEGKIGEADYSMLMNLRDALMRDDTAAECINGAKTEVSMFAHMPLPNGSSVPVRCRHDLYKPQYSTDLKFVEDVSREAVAKSIASYGYDRQAWFYPQLVGLCTGNTHNNFVTIFIEKDARYPKVLSVAYPDETLSIVESRVLERLDRFHNWSERYRATDVWPAFGGLMLDVFPQGVGGAESVILPNWWNYIN